MTSAAGFTLIDTLVTITIFCIIAGMAVPLVRDVNEGLRLNSAAREVERELQTARLKAVTTNRPMRVRFNCPAAGQFRMVELIGSPSVPAGADAPANRCSQTAYPFPAPDQNPSTVPNHDGALHQLQSSVTFGATKTLEFWPDGTAHEETGLGNPWPVANTAITLVKGSKVKTITVNGLGKILLQ